MMMRSIFFILAAGTLGTFAGSCQDEGHSKCVGKSGTGPDYTTCENGKEISKSCEGGEKCHQGSGTGIINDLVLVLTNK
ncbi:hypothetical protein BB561_005488 [Smittium simulii]|uniref:CBM1 domain-containing protein n=1 Tax=Smittium simulii TaxID=133385 RepID=A0A2T9YA60_9FUNG|nr:hypothetical protein BB561_005488 [Smittium simulii]